MSAWLLVGGVGFCVLAVTFLIFSIVLAARSDRRTYRDDDGH